MIRAVDTTRRPHLSLDEEVGVAYTQERQRWRLVRWAGAAMTSPYLEEARAMIQERNMAANMNVVDMARK